MTTPPKAKRPNPQENEAENRSDFSRVLTTIAEVATLVFMAIVFLAGYCLLA